MRLVRRNAAAACRGWQQQQRTCSFERLGHFRTADVQVTCQIERVEVARISSSEVIPLTRPAALPPGPSMQTPQCGRAAPALHPAQAWTMIMVAEAEAVVPHRRPSPLISPLKSWHPTCHLPTRLPLKRPLFPSYAAAAKSAAAKMGQIVTTTWSMSPALMNSSL